MDIEIINVVVVVVMIGVAVKAINWVADKSVAIY